jgi:hypothetical protein
MLWFYTRDQESLTVETRFDNDTQEYVATITDHGGQGQTKRFATAVSYREWLLNLERDLARQQWTPDGAPHILPDGWPDKPPLK